MPPSGVSLRIRHGERAVRAVRRAGLWMLLPALLALALSACEDAASFPFAVDPTVTPTPPADAATAPAEAQPAEDPTGDRQLVVWLPDFAGYTDAGGAADVLESAFRQFEQAHPNVRADVQVKAESGQADTLAYLRSAQRVAPAIMPDLVLVESQQIWHLVDLGLLSPMETSPLDRSPDFYPFAIDSVGYGGAYYGVPYVADVMHVAGFPALGAALPGTWEELLAASAPHLYAAAGADAYENGYVLVQYVGAGGQLLENGSTSSEEALLAVFDFVEVGRQSGVFPGAVAELATLDGVWNALLTQGSGFGNVSSARYLASREAAPPLAFGEIPTRNGMPTTVGATWAFAVLSEDAEQRALAFDLIDALLEPAVHGAWSQYVHRLPTQRTALQSWANPSAYTEFLGRQLEVAVALPNGRAFADFAERLLAAQLGVLRGESTVEEAMGVVRGPS